ncbi:FIST signal transduction protein [Pontibacter sp. JAM-7]|uniref:FIST signal transduction protein n=1 Tax=Pontibacter sp. JAM-7 TaxID=3366581 RepID=UPI003AF557B1
MSECIKVGIGHATSARLAAEQVQSATAKPNLVICFISAELDVAACYADIRDVLGESVPIIGGSSVGEMSSRLQGAQSGSVVIMSWQSSYLSVGTGVGESLAEVPRKAALAALEQAQTRLRTNPTVMSLMTIALESKNASDASRIKPFVNIVLPDGTSEKEEPFLRALLNETGRSSQVIGGSTAALAESGQSYQICDGVYQNSAVVTCISSALKIGTALGQPYLPAGRGLVVTGCEGRVVKSFNGKPAAQVLKQLLGCDELTPEVFAQNPFGVQSADVFAEFTIKSARIANPDQSVSFYSAITTGSFLRQMKTDRNTAISLFRKALERAIIDAGRPKKIAGVIVFNCILRHLLKSRLEIDDAQIIRDVCGEDVPFIGFNTFGEQGATLGGSLGHYNQTAAIMVIGDEVITQ